MSSRRQSVREPASRARSTRSPGSRSCSSTRHASKPWPTTSGQSSTAIRCRRLPGRLLARVLIVLAVLGALPTLVGACATPPQIVEISPLQGATSVPSNAPIRIRFDRPMDRASVQGSFRLVPRTAGTFHWDSSRELRYEHPALLPSTKYQVVLEGGYHDAEGGINTLRHSWIFSTEAPPEQLGSSPGDGEQGVDTAAYITLTFSREMDVSTLPQTMSVSPSTHFTVVRDPTDAHRVVVVPEALLQPNQEYSVTITTKARDVHGNR